MTLLPEGVPIEYRGMNSHYVEQYKCLYCLLNRDWEHRDCYNEHFKPHGDEPEDCRYPAHILLLRKGLIDVEDIQVGTRWADYVLRNLPEDDDRITARRVMVEYVFGRGELLTFDGRVTLGVLPHGVELKERSDGYTYVEVWAKDYVDCDVLKRYTFRLSDGTEHTVLAMTEDGARFKLRWDKDLFAHTLKLYRCIVGYAYMDGIAMVEHEIAVKTVAGTFDDARGMVADMVIGMVVDRDGIDPADVYLNGAKLYPKVVCVEIYDTEVVE